MSAQATIQIGSRVHALTGHTLGTTVEHVVLLDHAASGGAVAARVFTTALAVQQKDIAAIRAKMQAASQQAALQKCKSQTTLLDAPISLPVVRGRSPSPFGRSPPPSAAGAPPGSQPASGIASQPGPYNPSAPLWHPESHQSPALQPRPLQQQRRGTPVAPHNDVKRQALGKPKAAATVLKRPASGGQQQQVLKRQRIETPPSGQGRAAAGSGYSSWPCSGAAVGGVEAAQGVRQPQQRQSVERARTAGNKAAGQAQGPRMQLQLDSPISLPAAATAAAASASKKQQLQGKQQHSVPANPGTTGGAGKQWQHKPQQQVGMKRMRDENSGDNLPQKQQAVAAVAASAAATRSTPGHTNKGAAGNGMGRSFKATAAASGAGRASAMAAAIAAIRLERKAQLRSNKEYQNFGELEEGEILADLDDEEGHERIHPDPVPQGRAKPGAAGAAGKQKQQGKHQGKQKSKQPTRCHMQHQLVRLLRLLPNSHSRGSPSQHSASSNSSNILKQQWVQARRCCSLAMSRR
eukprot:GHUV01003122.1.p2 GENE.GHUV01003122.1~~GHUV01003122.1.p2  ORF type:complete len:521 (+),score=217.62 GHUV01003122.1:2878-4440(+)